MKRLISGVPFSECEYYPCGHVALDALLGFYGYDTPLVLHDQWFLLYQRPQDARIQIAPRVFTEIQSLRQLGIRVEMHQECDSETGWEKIKGRVDGGQPVAALLDTFNLEQYYYPGLGHHSDHYVIVDGYDEASDKVHIVDPSWIVRFRGDLPISGFKAGWGSEHIPQYQWMEFKVPEASVELSADRVVKSLQRNERLMLHEESSLPETFVGLYALTTLAEDLRQWKERINGAASAYLKQIYDQARSVIIERDGHARYLELAADVLGVPLLANVGEDLRNITQKWIVFRNLCLKAHRRNGPEIFEKLHARLLEIASLEEAALAKVREII